MASTRPRVAFGALSVPSHASTRCFQRATFRALALEEQHAAAGGWLRLPGGGEVLLRYVMSSPATAAEAASLRSRLEEVERAADKTAAALDMATSAN